MKSVRNGQPNQPLAPEVNAAIALYNAGRYAELESRARLMVDQFPGFGFGWKLLGGALQMQSKNALAAFQKTAELMPNEADAHYNLGVVLADLGKLDDALASYRRAVKIKPDFAEAHNNLGNVLKELGQLDEAKISYRRALQINHNSAEALNKLGVTLMERGQYDDAVSNFRNALKFKPDYARAYNNLGVALMKCEQFDDAVDNFRRALQLNPYSVEAHCNLGNILRDLGQTDGAIASCHLALEIKPTNAEAHNILGNVLQDIGQHEDAIASYRHALELKPDFDGARSNLLFCLTQSGAVNAQTLFAEHCRFGEQFEAPLRTNWPQHGNSRDPARMLQLGFVSAELRSPFIEPVLAHLSGYPQLSLHAYYNHTMEDAVTQRLKGYFTHWHPAVRQTDDALAEQIRADGIDILIDLSGHSGKNRLMTFARKPAPVQASWIGYPGTTGLTAMDYYLADRFFLPPGQFDSQFTEKIVYLPANAPFLPSTIAPSVNALPALSNGYLTFGSFNRPSKISRPVIALWSQLLRALPDSRILLGGMNKGGNYTTLIDWFAQEGITRERLDFHALCGMQTYLGLHHQVDICLDTFPYTGGTTTLHALWMGVPTLTLAGNTAAGRQGAAILGHAGLDVFVACVAADFVQQGLSWAGNLGALSDIRAGLRERFARSAMGQPALVAAGLERALRIMWQRWCEGLPPRAIDASGKEEPEADSMKNKISRYPGSQGR